MSDRTPEEELQDIERRAADLGVKLSPETLARLQRNLQESADFRARQQSAPEAPLAPEEAMAPLTAQGDSSALAPTAVGELGMDIRAEGGNEMKDRDIFTPPRLERKTAPRPAGEGEASPPEGRDVDEDEIRRRAERRLERL